MSAKNLDNYSRWRNKTVAFRVSPEENEQINAAVRLSGLTKQDYITRRLLNRDVVVQGNPRVYKALRNELAAVLAELRRVKAGERMDEALLDTINLIAKIMEGMKEDTNTLDCTRKFNNFWRSSFVVRKISDLLCWENGLSVIKDPKRSRDSYGTWLGEKPPTVRKQLERFIDNALTGCKDFNSFLVALKSAGVEVKQGKHLAFKIPGGRRFVQCSSLSKDYSETAILERIAGKRSVVLEQKRTAPSLLIDIQAKMQ